MSWGLASASFCFCSREPARLQRQDLLGCVCTAVTTAHKGAAQLSLDDLLCHSPSCNKTQAQAHVRRVARSEAADEQPAQLS